MKILSKATLLMVGLFVALNAQAKGEVSQSAPRSITVTNSAWQDIWVGVTTASVSCATSPAGGSDALCPTQATGSCGNGGVTCIGGPNKQNLGWCGDYPWDSSTGFCYQKLPTVSNTNKGEKSTSLHLKQGQSLTLSAPTTTPDHVPFVWSGNMFARTGCTSGSSGAKCQLGDCGAANSGNSWDAGAMCPPGAGGNPQGTLAEITMSNPDYVQPTGGPALGPDYYDISIINGVNVAAIIGPVNGKTSYNMPYQCTDAGSKDNQGQLSACSWMIKPVIAGVDRSTELRNVALPERVVPEAPAGKITGNGLCPKPGGGTIAPNKDHYCPCPGSTANNLIYPNASGFCPDPANPTVYPNEHGFFKVCNNGSQAPNSYGYCECDANTHCGDGTCGVAMNASAQQFTQVCGTFVGWTTADTLCSASNNTTPFLDHYCDESDANGSVTNYLGCTGSPEAATSCYNNATVASGYQKSCCGCATSKASVAAFPGIWPTVQTGTGTDNGCYGNNKDWVKYVQPSLVYLKKACPTAYVYPFDDATSTFTCRSTTADTWPNYQIRFEPLTPVTY